MSRDSSWSGEERSGRSQAVPSMRSLRWCRSRRWIAARAAKGDSAVGLAGERVSVVRSPEPAGGEVLLRVRSRADGVRLPTYEERKVVTVLFADLVGFTSRAEQMDPEDVRALLAVNTGRRW
jgi:class 3 adenylate cyclase